LTWPQVPVVACVALLVVLIAPTPVAAPAGEPSAERYDGPLVETHAHIVMYQSETNTEVQYRVEASERASELSIASYVSSLDRNNIKCSLGFHAIAFDEKQEELLDHARRLLLLYPDRFVLFAEIFRNNPLEWFFDASALDTLLATGLFAGLGEIQFPNSPLDGPPRVNPDDKRFLAIYEVLGDRGLFMMAHPRSREGLDAAVGHDRRVTWIIHGPHVHSHWTRINDDRDSLDALLSAHPNLYYTLDFGESLAEILDLTKRLDPRSGGDFLKVVNRDFDRLLETMVSTWKPIIEKYPDRFLWGTDMALPPWQWHAAAFDMMAKFSRAFIGRLDSPAAENYAYKNAERLLGSCHYSADIPVAIDIQPGIWPNTIDPESDETIRVAILSSLRLDAPRHVDVSTLTFGSTGDETSLAFCEAGGEDVNGDGRQDLVCEFRTANANFQSGATRGTLKGQTTGGRTIEGRDSVRIPDD